MALLGTGCFIVWAELAPGSEAEHDNWHSHEHMIERVAIPGFRRGRRFRALADSPRLCVIYEAADLGTFTSPAYLARLNAPTPWTRRVMPSYRRMNRSLCSVIATHGIGVGGYLATVSLSVQPGRDGDLESWLTGTLLADLAARPGLCGAHLLIADAAASGIATREKSLRGGADDMADWVVLVEGFDPDAVEQAAAMLQGPEGLPAHGAVLTSIIGRYTLDFTLAEVEAKAAWRPPES